MKENNIMLNKPKLLVKVIGEMSKVERLIYNYFLTLITDPMAKKDEKGYYYTTLAKINDITKINNYKKIEDNLKNLQHTSLHIDILDTKIFTCLIATIFIKDNEVKLFFPPLIVELAENKNPNYSRIDLRLLSKLNSKYSLTIYELIKTYYHSNNSKITIPDLTILDFRKLMGIENKLKTNQKIKETVLEQAKKDINNKTDFDFDFEFLKKNPQSKRFTHIRLSFTKDKQSIKDAIKSPTNDNIEELESKNKELEAALLLIEQLKKEKEIISKNSISKEKLLKNQIKVVESVNDVMADDFMNNEVFQDAEYFDNDNLMNEDGTFNEDNIPI